MNFLNDNMLKKVLYSFLIVMVIGFIVVLGIYFYYSKEIDNYGEEYSLQTKEYIIDNKKNESKEVSSTNDKKIENTNNSNTAVNMSINTTKSDDKKNTNSIKQEKNEVQNNVKKEEVKENKKELKFQAPVDGEIIKDFASETLVYSKTLDEWTTHLGIDIKGEKTGIVKSAEDGTVESIKNDPRYGTTIIISHQDGFKTVYSNLLTTEFVKEGDKVNKGDTIATIGETASFEVLDEPHLHFEMFKDENPINPTLYLK